MTASPRPARQPVFLEGAGQRPTVWDPVIARLPAGFEGLRPGIRGLSVDVHGPFSVDGAVAGLLEFLDEHSLQRAVVCGLSLGALVATQFAAQHPTRVSGLILSAAQVRPNRALMAAQNAVVRSLPARVFAGADGIGKRKLLEVLTSATRSDLRPLLPIIDTPTLVLCGARDLVNLHAARAVARRIPEAELRIVPGVGHEWNATHPALFADTVNGFMRCQPAP